MEKFKKLDQYQILQMIGKGANGLVYKGLNTTNGSIVAIKEMVMGKSDVKGIKAQLNLLKQLDHPCIVKYIDAIQKENRIYLILEYMEGGSLAALVRRSPLDEEVAKIYVKQVLKGLVFLHKSQVIHRDIKGANILLTKNGQVKLADFGVAVKLQKSQKTISAAGSPYWMAPQIISSQAEPTTKCDIWSLGCTVIELLTGNPPYSQLMQFPALFRIVEDAHPPLPACSNECKQFLLSCFAKQPKIRMSAQELLNSIWLKLAKDEQACIANDQDGKVREQIGQYLCPVINYNGLMKIAKDRKDSMIVCKHIWFQTVLLEARTNINIIRVQFIIFLIKNDNRVIEILIKFGLLDQQLSKFIDKYEFSEQCVTAISCLVQTLISAYQNMIHQIESNVHAYQNNQISNQILLQYVIIRNCIPVICKILLFPKERKQKTKQKMIASLHQFICAVVTLNSKERQAQILSQIIIGLQEMAGLKQICSLNSTQYQLHFVKLDILYKIIPKLLLLSKIKVSFGKIIILIFSQLLNIEYEQQKQNVKILRLMCLNLLMADDKLKHVAQKYGFIQQMSQFLARISKNTMQTNDAFLFECIVCMSKFLRNDHGGIDKNRVSQFYKRNTKSSIQIIYYNAQNQQKTKSKESKGGTLLEELTNIIYILNSLN